ncbi:MAG: carotenoid oxygenase family protein, partial [Myxococcota bacterium]
MSENLFLEGNFAPVAEEVTAFDLEVKGEIPKALEGRLLRIGPNPIAAD